MPGCSICSSPEVELFCTAFDRISNHPEKRWQILRCRACGFGWTFPPLAEEEIAAYYPPAYLGDVRQTLDGFLAGTLQLSRSWRKEPEKVRLLERIVRTGRILDVGSADSKFLLALDPRRWQRTGVEFNREVVDLVRSKVPGLQLVTGDIYSQELPNLSFDVITFWHVFEHLPDPRRVLHRVYRLLRPGGWLFLSVPNFDSWQARLFRRHWYAFDDVPRHLHHFSPRSLELLLQEAGIHFCRHVFFSRIVNIHCLKYSLINWSEERFGSRRPYYFLKPFLFLFHFLESFSRHYGMLTTIGRRPLSGF
ncbi:MAG TPA: class I SAM-dependent methyltransferase [Acidobacteriota bacterium]|jgi:SAM-dependent methyltransferase